MERLYCYGPLRIRSNPSVSIGDYMTEQKQEANETPLALTEEETGKLQEVLQLDEEKLNKLLKNLVKVFRALRGEPPDKEDFIHALMNMRDNRERSRIPSQVMLRRQLLMRTAYAQYGDVAESCYNWMEEELILYIAYKGLGREEAIDYKKAEHYAEGGQQPNVFFGGQPQQQQQKKKHFWNREPKKEQKYPSNEEN